MMIYGFPCGMIVSSPDEAIDLLLPTQSPASQRLEEGGSSREKLEGKVAVVGYVGECLSLAIE